MKTEMVSVDRLLRDPNNPRTDDSPEERRQLAESIRSHKVKVPLIGFPVQAGIMLADGHRRFEAARDIGLAELPVVVLAERPTEAELLSAQLTIGLHRQQLNPLDEYQAFARLAKLMQWSPSELAAGLTISNAEVTRVFSLGKLTPEEQQLVRVGKLSKSGAYALSRLPPEERASYLLKLAKGKVTRDELNSRARKKSPTEERGIRRIRCLLAEASVSIQSKTALQLVSLIELLEGLVRECRWAKSQGLDLLTAVRVMHDRSRRQAT